MQSQISFGRVLWVIFIMTWKGFKKMARDMTEFEHLPCGTFIEKTRLIAKGQVIWERHNVVWIRLISEKKSEHAQRTVRRFCRTYLHLEDEGDDRHDSWLLV